MPINFCISFLTMPRKHAVRIYLRLISELGDIIVISYFLFLAKLSTFIHCKAYFFVIKTYKLTKHLYLNLWHGTGYKYMRFLQKKTESAIPTQLGLYYGGIPVVYYDICLEVKNCQILKLLEISIYHIFLIYWALIIKIRGLEFISAPSELADSHLEIMWPVKGDHFWSFQPNFS